jgi:hypothetical protein
MYQVKKEITKQEIVDNFDYYHLVALSELLDLKFIELKSTRMDLEAKKLKIETRNGKMGVVQYGVFYSHDDLKKKQEEAELIGTLVESMLKLKEMEIGFPKNYQPKQTQLQYYAQNYKQIWKLIYEKEKWYLARVEDVPVPPINWGD